MRGGTQLEKEGRGAKQRENKNKEQKRLKKCQPEAPLYAHKDLKRVAPCKKKEKKKQPR